MRRSLVVFKKNIQFSCPFVLNRMLETYKSPNLQSFSRSISWPFSSFTSTWVQHRNLMEEISWSKSRIITAENSWSLYMCLWMYTFSVSCFIYFKLSATPENLGKTMNIIKIDHNHHTCNNFFLSVQKIIISALKIIKIEL